MSLRFGILTVSDRSSRGERPDASGPVLVKIVKERDWLISKVEVVPDNFAILQETLIQWADSGNLDVILTTGGTGFSPRDITPEATQTIIERSAPGLAEAMRTVSLQVTPYAMLSRGVAGIRGGTLIVNLPGKPKSIRECLDAVFPAIPYCIDLLEGPYLECNEAVIKPFRPKK